MVRAFRWIWIVDFEFSAPAGERPHPLCLVAVELESNEVVRLWEDELELLTRPPYGVGEDSLFVSYYAAAEVGCHLALGWPLPVNVLDLYVEFRNLTNGLRVPCGQGLIGALTWFGLDVRGLADKSHMRELALRGGPWTAQERNALFNYCERDVRALAQLFRRMAA